MFSLFDKKPIIDETIENIKIKLKKLTNKLTSKHNNNDLFIFDKSVIESNNNYYERQNLIVYYFKNYFRHYPGSFEDDVKQIFNTNDIKKYTIDNNNAGGFIFEHIHEKHHTIICLCYAHYKFNNKDYQHCEQIQYNIDTKLGLLEDMLSYDLTKLSNNNPTFLSLLKEKYKVIKNQAIVIYDDINPIYYTMDGIELKVLPNKCSTKINEVKIYTDENNQLIKVLVNNYHPNANTNNEFCIGNLKHRQLTIDCVDDIINCIKIYNISNYYTLTTPLKELIGMI